MLRLTAQQRTDKKLLMEAHGFDPIQWELIDATSNLWQGPSPSGKVPYYQSKIRVKPTKTAIDLDMLLDKISTIKPVPIISRPSTGSGLLEVFLTDQHFGLDNDYSNTLQTVIDHCANANEIVIVIGSDAIHVDNVSNTTVKGTQLEPIDLNKAWEEMYSFYFNLIHSCVSNQKQTYVKYIPGNHDSTLAWTVLKSLEKALPDASYDTSHEHFKAFRYCDVAIGWTHGDTGKKTDYDRLFRAQFPEMGTAKTIELHAGHLHREMVNDVFGTMIRTLPTGTERSGWTKDNGYHSVRRFQCFLYGEDSLKAIYYV